MSKRCKDILAARQAFYSRAMGKTTITKITIRTHRRTVVQLSGGQPVENVADDERPDVPAPMEQPAGQRVRPSKDKKENKVYE